MSTLPSTSDPAGAAGDRRRRVWGWGYEDEQPTAAERDRLRDAIVNLLGLPTAERPDPPPVDAWSLPDTRCLPPSDAGSVRQTHYERLLHAAGKSFADLRRLRDGVALPLPDAVVYPEHEAQVATLLSWASAERVAVIPFGGGTSVTGGVTPRVPDRFRGVVALDLTRLRRVHEIDDVSRLVHADAGILAPDLDATLAEHGLATRHYPQSYYFTTLGGWVATRSGGHYSTLLGKIEDRVAGLTVMTADGATASTRVLPAGSVGPDPNRLWAGSEGALGVITRVWLRVMPEPGFKRTAAIRFPTFDLGLEAARAIVQAGFHPTHLRVLDPFEAMVSAALSGGMRGELSAWMILGFESASEPTDEMLRSALRIATRFKGRAEVPGEGGDDDAVAGWRQSFFRQPYIRDLLIGWGLVVDTFETAVPWRHANALSEQVRAATQAALQTHCGGGGVLMRTTHAYSDGVAFYFTFFGPGRPGAEIDQWWAVKRAATDAVLAAGGTASHHHACGRDHAEWALREHPETWRRAFVAVKAAVDPAGVLNPGVIFPAA